MSCISGMPQTERLASHRTGVCCDAQGISALSLALPLEVLRSPAMQSDQSLASLSGCCSAGGSFGRPAIQAKSESGCGVQGISDALSVAHPPEVLRSSPVMGTVVATPASAGGRGVTGGVPAHTVQTLQAEGHAEGRQAVHSAVGFTKGAAAEVAALATDATQSALTVRCTSRAYGCANGNRRGPCGGVQGGTHSCWLHQGLSRRLRWPTDAHSLRPWPCSGAAPRAELPSMWAATCNLDVCIAYWTCCVQGKPSGVAMLHVLVWLQDGVMTLHVRIHDHGAQTASDTASSAAEACMDYSKSAAQNASEMAAAAKRGAGDLAQQAQPYVDAAAERARAGLGKAAEAGQGAAQQARCGSFFKNQCLCLSKRCADRVAG